MNETIALDRSKRYQEPAQFAVYITYRNTDGDQVVRRVTDRVAAENLFDRLATVQNCFPDATVHVVGIFEEPYATYLPKCAETGSCGTASIPDDTNEKMNECIG